MDGGSRALGWRETRGKGRGEERSGRRVGGSEALAVRSGLPEEEQPRQNMANEISGLSTAK